MEKNAEQTMNDYKTVKKSAIEILTSMTDGNKFSVKKICDTINDLENSYREAMVYAENQYGKRGNADNTAYTPFLNNITFFGDARLAKLTDTLSEFIKNKDVLQEAACAILAMIAGYNSYESVENFEDFKY